MPRFDQTKPRCDPSWDIEFKALELRLGKSRIGVGNLIHGIGTEFGAGRRHQKFRLNRRFRLRHAE